MGELGADGVPEGLETEVAPRNGVAWLARAEDCGGRLDAGVGAA